jgi:hypothetical protein
MFGGQSTESRVSIRCGGDEIRALRELRRQFPDSGFVFATERGGPFTPDAVNRLIKRLGERACWLRFPGPRSHAAARLRLPPDQRWPRYVGHPGLPWTPLDTTHRSIHRVVTDPAQRLLEILSAVRAAHQHHQSPRHAAPGHCLGALACLTKGIAQWLQMLRTPLARVWLYATVLIEEADKIGGEYVHHYEKLVELHDILVAVSMAVPPASRCARHSDGGLRNRKTPLLAAERSR